MKKQWYKKNAASKNIKPKYYRYLHLFFFSLVIFLFSCDEFDTLLEKDNVTNQPLYVVSSDDANYSTLSATVDWSPGYTFKATFSDPVVNADLINSSNYVLGGGAAGPCSYGFIFASGGNTVIEIIIMGPPTANNDLTITIQNMELDDGSGYIMPDHTITYHIVP